VSVVSNSDSYPCVAKFNVDTKSRNFLVDTGAQVSICKKNVVEGKQIFSPNNIRNIHGIEGKGLQVLGSADVDLKIKNKKFTDNFVVCNDNLALDTDGLLGLDFLCQNKARIDLGEHSLELDGLKLPLLSKAEAAVEKLQYNDCNNVTMSDSNTSNVVDVDSSNVLLQNKTSSAVVEDTFVILKESIEIPARCEAVCVGLHNSVATGTRLIEPVDVGVNGVLSARLLVQSSSAELPIRLVNISDGSVKIPAKTKIGRLEVVDEVESEVNLNSDIVANKSVLMISGSSFEVDKYFKLDHLSAEAKTMLTKLLKESIKIFLC
jgi:hypothetical protein